jgi:TPR repeat protein
MAEDRPRYRDPIYQTARGWPITAIRDACDGDEEAQLYLAFVCYNSNKMDDCIRWYTAAANQGNEEAMMNLAKIHEQGLGGTPIDLIQACQWMKKLAETSIREDSQFRDDILQSYGFYLLGAKTPSNTTHGRQQSLPKDRLDVKEGIVWVERAGELGSVFAASTLGNLYMTGQHPQIPTNVPKGMYWFKRAAQMGDGRSAYQLAMVYTSGLVPSNATLQKKWLEVAAELGYHTGPDQEAIKEAPKHSSLDKKEMRRRLRHLDKEKNLEELLPTDETNKCSCPDCDNEESGSTSFGVCPACRYVKYCSKKCQNRHWSLGHKNDCKKLQESKNQMIEMNRNSIAPRVECFNPECSKREKGDSVFSRCSKCQYAKYCSKDCQITHWRSGGHKSECKKHISEVREVDEMLEKLRTERTQS